MKRSVRRALFVTVVALGVASIGACSSFSASSAPAVDEASAVDVAEASAGDETPTSDTGCDPDSSDLQSDALNCGRCGHSCLGGSCEMGICQPFLFATSDDSKVVDLRIELTRALWTTSSGTPWAISTLGQLYESSLTGQGHAIDGGSVTPMLAQSSVLGSLEVGEGDAGSLVSFNSEIDSVGVNVNPTQYAHGSDFALHVHVFGNTLYYVPASSGGGQVVSLPVPGGAPFTGYASLPAAIVDYTVQGNTLVMASGNQFVACTTGANATTVNIAPNGSTEASAITAFAADDTRVYWSTGGGAVYSCIVTLDGNTGTCHSSVTVLTVTSEIIRNISIEQNMLWAASDANKIYACPLTGCAPNPAPFVTASGNLYDATEYLNGRHFAATSTAFFWAQTTSSGHQIMEVAR